MTPSKQIDELEKNCQLLKRYITKKSIPASLILNELLLTRN